ncbi:hypothetical protein QYE76_071101 [Lolium multiflorum]|uniref:DNA-directed RNA polymerase n=1 Tax=Lolium multiflorum TaxID=4521 RepID=A0AAD8WE97_LOLMU|nr:hypothetical protein QYE76_071101 [Lolium multiflorum]
MRQLVQPSGATDKLAPLIAWYQRYASYLKDMLGLQAKINKRVCRIFDGRTGDPFEQPVLIEKSYILKLIHQVDEKIHGRSTGPRSSLKKKQQSQLQLTEDQQTSGYVSSQCPARIPLRKELDGLLDHQKRIANTEVRKWHSVSTQYAR